MAKTISSEDLALIQNSPVVVVADTETTGLSPDKGASLLEIGAVLLDVQNKKITGKFSQFVRPLLNFGKVPSKITEITGITQDDVETAQEQELVMDQFWHFIGAYPLVFHNAPFDWRFLLKAFNGIGVNPVNPILDTMAISKKIHPSFHSHSLASLSEHYGHPIEGHHRAVVDAKYTASIYLRMKDELPVQEVFTTVPNQKKILLYDPSNLRILRVRYWESGKRSRIYVTTSAGVFFYDIGRSVWAVSDMRIKDRSLDCKACGLQILTCLGMNLNEFVKKYQGTAA